MRIIETSDRPVLRDVRGVLWVFGRRVRRFLGIVDVTPASA